MHYQKISVDKEGHVCLMVLGRPEVPSTIDLQMAAEIEDACHKIRQDADNMVVIVTGVGGQAFSSGSDIEAIGHTGRSHLVDSRDLLLLACVPNAVADIECPVIAAINGDARGTGLALALACDLRIASEEATFSVPYVSLGHLLPSGITQRLPRTVGQSRAMEILLTGAEVRADEALRMGLVQRVVPPSEVISEAKEVAEVMASRAPLALRYVKEAVTKGMDLTLSQGLRLECDLYMILQTTEDRVEGITAFRDKRKPFFKGK